MRHASIWLSSVVMSGALAGTAEAAPAISLEPDPITFDAVIGYHDGGPVGERQSGGWYWIVNTGDVPLVVTGMAITGANAGIIEFDADYDPLCSGQDCTQTFSVAPGEVRSFMLDCTPAQPGYFSASLAITSNAASGTSTSSISCVGNGPPIVELSPSSLDFGISHSCWVGDLCGPSCGTRPLTQTLAITNTAAAPSELIFHLTPALPSGHPYDEFVISNWCTETWPCHLGPGETLSIEITFRPHGGQAQLYTAPLTLVTAYPGQPPIQIPFYAEGGFGNLQLDSPSLLGSVAVGQALITTYTVHNAGRTCLEFDNPTSDNPAIEIDAAYPGRTVLGAGESHTWTVRCTPPSVAGASANIGFELHYENVDLVSQPVHCLGLGGSLAVTPDVIAFIGADEVAVGSSASRRVRVRNAGNQPTELVAMTSTAPSFAAALVTGTLPLALAPGDELEVDVTFAPTVPGWVTGSITFDGSNGDDFTAPVLGDGVVLEAGVAPGSHDFGAIAYPETPAQPFQLHNGGTRALTVNAVTLDLPGDFTVVGLASGAVIAAGATVSFDIHATPTALGHRHATVVIDLDRVADLSISLDALAVDPGLVVTTADAAPDDYAVDLGGVDVDVAPKISHVMLHNTTAIPIAITTCSITGDPAFAIASSPFTIAANTTADLAITFAPAAEAASTAIVTLTGTGLATGALRLELRGVGLDQHVALSTMAIGFPDTFRHPIDAPARTVTVRNTAAAELVLSAITAGGAGFSVVGPTAATLAPGAMVDVIVAFAPATSGDATGQLVLGNTDDPAIARVALTGRGIGRTVEVGPLAIDLGAIVAGSTLRLTSVLPDAIVIRNIDPAATFRISSATISGSPAFELIGPDRTSLPPGEHATLDVQLAAASLGRHDATIEVFLDGDPEPHARIALTALAVAPQAPASGCGCSTGAPTHGIALAAAVLFLVLRRRVTRHASR